MCRWWMPASQTQVRKRRSIVKLDEPRLRAVDRRSPEDDVYVEVGASGGVASVVGRETRTVTLAGGQAEGETQGRVTASLAEQPALPAGVALKTESRSRCPTKRGTGVVTVECDQLAGSAAAAGLPMTTEWRASPCGCKRARDRRSFSTEVGLGRRKTKGTRSPVAGRWEGGIRRGHRKTLRHAVAGARRRPYSVEI